jgi:hypothetical protein
MPGCPDARITGYPILSQDLSDAGLVVRYVGYPRKLHPALSEGLVDIPASAGDEAVLVLCLEIY